MGQMGMAIYYSKHSDQLPCMGDDSAASFLLLCKVSLHRLKAENTQSISQLLGHKQTNKLTNLEVNIIEHEILFDQHISSALLK
jgi:hypothetical protein